MLSHVLCVRRSGGICKSILFLAAAFFVIGAYLRVPVIANARADRSGTVARDGFAEDIVVERNALAVVVEILGAVPGYAEMNTEAASNLEIYGNKVYK